MLTFTNHINKSDSYYASLISDSIKLKEISNINLSLIKNLNEKVSDNVKISSANKDNITELSNKIKTLEAEIASLKSGAQLENISDNVISEIQNRLNKMNNIILYGVEEEKTSNDFGFVFNLIHNIAPCCIVDCHRIGETVNDKPRPIRVEIKNKNQVINIIKNRNKLPENYAIMMDKTKKQRAHLHQLKEQIEEHNHKFPTHMKTISYTRGFPEIVYVTSDS